MTSNKAVVGLVNTHAQADEIVDALQRAGVSQQEISALFPDKRGTQDFAMEKNTKAPEGAVTGASAGGAVGGTIGLLAGIGALAIPGLGPFIAAGPILAALSGAAAGAAVGGITGALIGMGIPELEAKVYEGKIAAGHILLSVHAEDSEQRDRIKTILERGGAADVSVTGEKSVPERPQPSRSMDTH